MNQLETVMMMTFPDRIKVLADDIYVNKRELEKGIRFGFFIGWLNESQYEELLTLVSEKGGEANDL